MGRAATARRRAGPMPELSAWPVDPAVIAPFLLAVAATELTPGPNMGWLALTAASRGRSAGVAAVVGVTLGLAAWMAAAAFGLTQVLMARPEVYQAVRWAGVAFLGWLAWEAWRARPPRPAATDAGDTATRRGLFLRGLAGNLLNPKAALFYVALLPGFTRPGHGGLLGQALFLGSLHLAVAAAVHLGIVLAAAATGPAIFSRLTGVRARGAMALALAAVAVWTAWQTRG